MLPASTRAATGAHAEQEREPTDHLGRAHQQRHLPGGGAEAPALEALDVGVVVDELAEPGRDVDREDQRRTRVAHRAGPGSRRKAMARRIRATMVRGSDEIVTAACGRQVR